MISHESRTKLLRGWQIEFRGPEVRIPTFFESSTRFSRRVRVVTGRVRVRLEKVSEGFGALAGSGNTADAVEMR